MHVPTVHRSGGVRADRKKGRTRHSCELRLDSREIYDAVLSMRDLRGCLLTSNGSRAVAPPEIKGHSIADDPCHGGTRLLPRIALDAPIGRRCGGQSWHRVCTERRSGATGGICEVVEERALDSCLCPLDRVRPGPRLQHCEMNKGCVCPRLVSLSSV